MNKSQSDTQTDIAKQNYHGPSAAVEAVGHGAIEHLLYAVIGLCAAFPLAYVFHKPVVGFIDKARQIGTNLKVIRSQKGDAFSARSRDTLETWAGNALHVVFGDPETAGAIKNIARSAEGKQQEWLENIAMNREQGFGNWFLSHTIGALPFVGTRFKDGLQGLSPRARNAIAFGGAAGALGYIGGWGKALFTGAKHGSKGKLQFEQAKEEILQLRDTNTNLHKKLDDVSARLRDATTTEKLRVTTDDNSVRSTDITDDTKDRKEDHPKASLDNAEHHGKLAAEPTRETVV